MKQRATNRASIAWCILTYNLPRHPPGSHAVWLTLCNFCTLEKQPFQSISIALDIYCTRCTRHTSQRLYMLACLHQLIYLSRPNDHWETEQDASNMAHHRLQVDNRITCSDSRSWICKPPVVPLCPHALDVARTGRLQRQVAHLTGHSPS